MSRREMMLPALQMEARLDAETYDADTRTIELRWYTGAQIARYSYFDGPYQLRFSMDPKHVLLDRLGSGNAPLKAGHSGHGYIGGVVGVIEKAWLADDGGHAKVRFSARDDVAPILQDVRDGIIRNVSMEAAVLEIEDETPKGSKEKHYCATKWQPMAVALVAVGADPDAQALALSQHAEKFPCVLLSSAEDGAQKETKMSDLNDTDPVVKPDAPAPVVTPLAADPKSEARKVDDKIAADEEHATQVRRAGLHFNCNEVWIQKHIKLGTPMDQVLKDGHEERARNAPVLDGKVSVGEDFNSLGWRTGQMAEALAARARRVAPVESARQYYGRSIAECAFECLELNGRTRGVDLDVRRAPWTVIKAALHTTSDFPKILGDTLNKILVPAYEQANPTFRRIGAPRTFRDFRPHRFVKGGDFPAPLEKDEHGEFQRGTMGEASELVSMVSYGRIFGITREILVNDDLSFFDQLAGAGGRRIADFENSTFYSVCILAASGLGPTLTEGSVAVYNAAHGNIGSSGALSNDRLSEARKLMLMQTSIDGLKLNVMGKYLLAPPSTITLAETLLAALYPSAASGVNPFAGKLEAITDANLGASSTRFYVLADPAVLPNYIYGGLEGQAGPRFETRAGWEVDGLEVRLADDFGCGAIDWRGGVTAAGA